jgi:predicted metal-dependent peptidase
MNAKEIIDEARAIAAMDHPFWATFTLGKEWVEDNSQGTAYTDGNCMGYNSEFIVKLHQDYKMRGVVALIVHEAAHIFLGHHLRKGDRNHDKWNIACDHVVNNLILECKPPMSLKGLWTCDPKYKGWCVEDVYNDLPSGQSPSSSQTPGEVRVMKNPDGTQMGEAEIDSALHNLRVSTRTAASLQSIAGKLPASLREMVKDLLEPKVNWRDALALFVAERAKNDFNMSKPRPTAACCGHFAPTLESEDAPTKIVLAVDSSGSMNFEEACSEVHGILLEYEDMNIDTNLTVVYCDAVVHHIEVLEPGQHPFKDGKGGGGGTKFSPVMEWVNANADSDIGGLVYITDGFTEDFGEDPNVPVLWVLTQQHNPKFDPPFGSVVISDIKSS